MRAAAGERGASAAGGSSCTVCEPQPASAPSATASERLRRRRMAAASHARAPAFRGASVVPRIVIFAAAATVVAGTLIRHIHGGLGTATPPFVMVWGPRLHPLAVASMAVAAIAIVLAPRLVVAADRPASFAARVLALALVLGLALNVARAGTRGWDAIFDLRPGGSFEASNEYLPGLPALSYGTHFYLDRFAELVPSLPVNVAGHPPAPLLVLHGLGLTTAAGAAALCIGAAALSAPLTYALGRAVGSERDARVAAVLFACSPAALLFGVTSFDAVFATCGLAAAALLAAERGAVRAAGAVALAVASLFSWALLAVGAWATALAWRRRGAPAAAGLAAACAAAWLALNGALAAAYGYDPIGTLRATEQVYRHSVAIGASICVLGRRLTRGVGRHARPPDRRRRAALVRARQRRGGRAGGGRRRRRRGRLHEGRDRAHLAVPRPAGLRGGGARDHPAANDGGDRGAGGPGARDRGALRHHLVIGAIRCADTQ